VALVFVLSPLAGILLLFGSDTAGLAMAATILVGLGLGAEVDLIAFLITRYLGLKAFGEIYGYLFLTFMFGSGLGPFVMGLSFAKTGSYTTTMVGFTLGLALSAILLLRLGAYRFGVHEMKAGEATAAA